MTLAEAAEQLHKLIDREAAAVQGSGHRDPVHLVLARVITRANALEPEARDALVTAAVALAVSARMSTTMEEIP